MQLIYDINDLSSRRNAQAAAPWTALVPAAGKGSRLNVPGPKILYPILGKPLLEWLVERLEPLCGNCVFVLSPDGAPQVEPLLKASLGARGHAVIQEKPTGMADAIALCEKSITSPYTLILWGDQITTRASTLAACMTLLESSPALLATIPTMERDNPYIHFIRDTQDRITQVFEARESDQKIPRGESDCGTFLFRTEALFRILRASQGNAAFQGAKTKERNFLSLIPLFNDAHGSIATVRIHDAEETVGINTPADADQVAQILKRRKA